MTKIDCVGDICPVPLIKIQNQLKKIDNSDTFIVVVDHSCVVESIDDYYKNTSHKIEIIEVINGVWEIFITKNNS